VTTAAAPDGSAVWRPGEIWRDIARGGLAGIVVGLFVAGIGGRLAMRLATLLEPGAIGSFTENAAEIGVISFRGTLSVITIGIVAGAAAGVLWVIVRTWLPGAGLRRALVTAVVSIAFGSFLLVRGTNSDFVILGFNPVVVGALVVLVGAVGFFISMVDGWLDRRLPFAASVRSPSTSVYAAITLVGVLLILPLVVITFLGLSADEVVVRRAPLRPVGIGLFVLGIATMRWWFLRLRGADRPPRSLLLFGRAALAITVLLGVLIELPEIRTALGIY
jgi:hypothetical protein